MFKSLFISLMLVTATAHAIDSQPYYKVRKNDVTEDKEIQLHLMDGSVWTIEPRWYNIASQWEDPVWETYFVYVSWFNDTMLNSGHESPLLINILTGELAPVRSWKGPVRGNPCALQVEKIDHKHKKIHLNTAGAPDTTDFIFYIENKHLLKKVRQGDLATILNEVEPQRRTSALGFTDISRRWHPNDFL